MKLKEAEAEKVFSYGLTILDILFFWLI